MNRHKLHRIVAFIQQQAEFPFEVDEVEAEVLREIFHSWVGKGMSDREIALDLTAKKVPTPTGAASFWDPSSIRLILQSEAYVGQWYLMPALILWRWLKRIIRCGKRPMIWPSACAEKG